MSLAQQDEQQLVADGGETSETIVNAANEEEVQTLIPHYEHAVKPQSRYKN